MKQFICTTSDILKWILRLLGTIVLIIIIWYGTKPLANEQSIQKNLICIDGLKREVNINVSEVETVKKKVNTVETTLNKMDKKMSNQNIMIKLLLQKEGIQVPKEIDGE